MSHSFFIAGTDTGIGKTLVAATLLEAANRRGLSTAALKPLAAGCEATPDGLRNEDALILQQASSMDQEYQEVNPIALQQAVAPHIAATNTGKRLSAERLAGFCRGVLMKRADLTIIEGAGGWRVPLNARETLAELPRLLEQPVILVVGMKLGCINHALLTAEAISRDGLKLAGWVANRIDPQMSAYEENLQTLISLINAPLIAEFPFMEDPTPRGLTHFVDLDQLLTLNK